MTLKNHSKKEVGPLLGLAIFIMPYFFAWLTLIKGYSLKAKVISFIWMTYLVGIIIFTHDSDSNEPSIPANRVIAQETDFLRSVYTFSVQNGNYYYSVRHVDGSGGRYPLRKSGNRYYDIESNFGEYYIIETSGVRVYDENGFVRDL